MTESKIEWTDSTWNPVRGCARVSPGCESCYAERQAHRFSGAGQPYEGLTVLGRHGPRWSGRARFVPEMLDAPLRWKRPRRVFVNSMSDLFHADLTNEQIAAVFGVMAAAPRHTFQVLTKRPQRMLEWFDWLGRDTADWADPPTTVVCGTHAANYGAELVDYLGLPDVWPLPNVWLGVSCEDQKRADERIPLLLQCPAAVRFVSAEPLLDFIDFAPALGAHGYASSSTSRVDWIIAGGESGPGARPCRLSWLQSIAEQCRIARTACFIKQLGAEPWEDRVFRGVDQSMGLKDRKGGDQNEWPADLRVRQFPEARS